MVSTNREADKDEKPNKVRGALRAWAFLLVIDIIAFALGVGFFLIAHGLVMGVIRQAPHWQPARRFLERVVGFGFPVPSSQSHQARVVGYALSALWMALSAFTVGFGIWLLFSQGFWEQNLIWSACH